MKFELILFTVIYNFVFCLGANVIDLTNYHYPKNRGILKDRNYQIAIMGTNDLHGYMSSRKAVNLATQEKYEAGGLVYLASYIRTLRKEWGKRFLWFDAGDEFQGGLESKLSKGAAITNFFNLAGLNAATFGNHQFDYGTDYLNNRTQASKFKYVVSNIYDKTKKSFESFSHQVKSEIFTAGMIKVGVIGITTVETILKSKQNMTNYDFKQYVDVIIPAAKELRKRGAKIIILLSHAGLICKNNRPEDLILQMWNSKNGNQETCDPNGGEIPALLELLPPKTIDAIIAGHEHTINHFFFNDIPIISSTQYGEYTNVMYFSFDRKTLKYLPKKTIIEGPLPICGKIYSNTKRCSLMNEAEASKAGDLSEFLFHGKKMVPDKVIAEEFAIMQNTIDTFAKETIVETDVYMPMVQTQENFIGNFIADTFKGVVNADFSVLNSGFFRYAWQKGKISKVDFHTMFPHDNQIVTFEMTGAEIKRMVMDIETKGTKYFYQFSGLRRTYKMENSHPVIIDVTMLNGDEIINDKTYTVSSVDFVIPTFGDDFKYIKEWYTPKNMRFYGDVVEGLIQYLKPSTEFKTIREKDYLNPDSPRLIKIDN